MIFYWIDEELLYTLHSLFQITVYSYTGDIPRFKEHTFCSFEYLLAMADGDHIQRVFSNLEIIRTLLVDSDIHLLNLTIQSSGVGLHSSPLQLANEIIGRMRQIKGEIKA